ncbi:hypothetical protein PCASD_18693 [Puccinia coronata f. sp. avenae]|uniref:Uncharacterized protein n=1 Tax=Puccinia coronata f. sp. avenae TaxID=200324 RepID=A0A2N5U0S4_9BASI|nr:hypothetical protein PCASD_18693 [Puccinia coronata f. sp. avenae]
MQHLLALLPEEQEGLTSPTPEDPPAAQSPAIDVPETAVESPSKALIDRQSNTVIPLPNSNTPITEKDVSDPLLIYNKNNCNQIGDINPTPNKNLLATNKTTPLFVITDIKGYNFTTGGKC